MELRAGLLLPSAVRTACPRPLSASGGLGHSLAYRLHSPYVFTSHVIFSRCMSVTLSNYPLLEGHQPLAEGPP